MGTGFSTLFAGLNVIAALRDFPGMAKIAQTSILPSPSIVAATSKGDACGYDDLVDLCHGRPFARRRRLGVLSLACMEDGAPIATDAGSHKARTLPDVRRRLPPDA